MRIFRLRLTEVDLREFCTSGGWYSTGTDEDFETMLRSCETTFTPDRLQRLAEDIVKHTREYEKHKYSKLYSEHLFNGTVSDVMYKLQKLGNFEIHDDESNY